MTEPALDAQPTAVARRAFSVGLLSFILGTNLEYLVSRFFQDSDYTSRVDPWLLVFTWLADLVLVPIWSIGLIGSSVSLYFLVDGITKRQSLTPRLIAVVTCFSVFIVGYSSLEQIWKENLAWRPLFVFGFLATYIGLNALRKRRARKALERSTPAGTIGNRADHE